MERVKVWDGKGGTKEITNWNFRLRNFLGNHKYKRWNDPRYNRLVEATKQMILNARPVDTRAIPKFMRLRSEEAVDDQTT